MSPVFEPFDIALRRGEARERAFAAIFADQELVTIECKSEINSRSHVFIELSAYGKLSGLSVSRAEYWAIEVTPDVWVLLPASRLRRYADEAWRSFGIKRGGEGGLSRGVAIPKSWLLRPGNGQ